MSAGETMRAVVLYGREDARLEQAPVPPVGPGEVRMRVRAALTCGTDLKVFRRGYHAKMIVPPAIFGHEMSGEIEAVGSGVTEWQVGDRVVPANSAPCGACPLCHEGREELCDDLLFLNGAYAEYVAIPGRIVRKNLLPIPSGLSFAAAALTEPLACALLGVRQTGVREGETVAVLGAGPLGLLLTRCAALAGARVLVAGRREARLHAARQMGAAETFLTGPDTDPGLVRDWVWERTGGRGADRVIEAVGRPEAWEEAIALARKGGTINLFGGCPSGTTVSLDTGRIHYDALTLLGSFHHTPGIMREALGMLAAGKIPVEAIVQEQTSLDDLPELLRRLAPGGGPLKVAIDTAA